MSKTETKEMEGVEPILIQAGDKRVLLNGSPSPVPCRVIAETKYQTMIAELQNTKALVEGKQRVIANDSKIKNELHTELLKAKEIRDKWFNDRNKLLAAINPDPRKSQVCRDCADNNGRCEMTNLPCDPIEEAIERFRRAKEEIKATKVCIQFRDIQLEQAKELNGELVKFVEELLNDYKNHCVWLNFEGRAESLIKKSEI